MEPAKKLQPISAPEDQREEKKGFFAKLGSIKVGAVPLPLYVLIALVVYAAAAYESLPADMIGGFAVIMAMGILLGDIGMRIPILKDIGGPAILSLLVPSILVFFNIINTTGMDAVTQLMKTSNFLYL